MFISLQESMSTLNPFSELVDLLDHKTHMNNMFTNETDPVQTLKRNLSQWCGSLVTFTLFPP